MKDNENNIKEKKARKRKTDKTSDETSENNIIINQFIEDKYLELYDPAINEVNNQIMYYRKLKFQEKKFTLFTKKEDIENYNNLYIITVLITVLLKQAKKKIIKASKNVFVYAIQK